MDGNLRRNTLILVCSLAATLVIYLFAYWLPQRRLASELRAEIQQKKAGIDQCKQRAMQLVMFRAELANLQTANQQAAQQIPPALNVKEFLATVHSLGQDAGISVANVTPGLVTDLVGVQQQPISLALVGRFHPLMKLIYDLESLGRIVELSDLDIRSPDKSAGADDTLEVKLTVRLFAKPSKVADSAQHNG